MKDLFIFFKVIIFLAYFRGLRHVELMDLKIEKMVKKNDVMLVTQCRLKQRSDKQETKFLVPNDGPVNFAAVIDDYLNVIKVALVSRVEYFLRVFLLHMLTGLWGIIL